jgi:hypothetical protein
MSLGGTSRDQAEFYGDRSVEHYRLVAVDQDAVIEVPAHGAGQHDFFEVAAFAYEVASAKNANSNVTCRL